MTLATYTKESHRWSAGDRSVADVRLSGQVFRWLDRRNHSVDGQKSGQVCRVRWDEDESEEPPGAPDHPRRDRPRVDVRSLLHQRSHDEPERVREGEGVFEEDAAGVGDTRPAVVPLVRREARQYEHRQTHGDVRTYHVEPDLGRQRTEEREETGAFAQWPLEEDADAEVHKRFREVDHLFT